MKATNMLKIQADRIAELEKELTKEKIKELWLGCKFSDWDRIYEFAKKIREYK